MLSLFPRDVLDEIWDLIGSVSEGFPAYSWSLRHRMIIHVDHGGGLNMYQEKRHLQHVQATKTQTSLCIHNLSIGRTAEFFCFILVYRKKVFYGNSVHFLSILYMDR